MVKITRSNSLKISLLILLILSVTVASADEIVIDQKQEELDGSTNIVGKIPIGQEFTPTMSPLVAVEIYITAMNDAGDDTVTVNIRELTIDGPILVSSSQLVTEGSEGWIRFDLAPIAVSPGSLYVIEVVTTKTTFGWYEGYLDVYPGGQGITFGSSYMDDFVFRTYTEFSEPVGGELLPMGAFLSILPYIVTVLLLTATSQVFVKKYRS